MKKILFLNDETAHPTQLLQDAVGTAIPGRDTEAVAGCNCDRWGHPCPGCVDRIVQPTAKLPIQNQARN
jgi:hypothetical protein